MLDTETAEGTESGRWLCRPTKNVGNGEEILLHPFLQFRSRIGNGRFLFGFQNPTGHLFGPFIGDVLRAFHQQQAGHFAEELNALIRPQVGGARRRPRRSDFQRGRGTTFQPRCRRRWRRVMKGKSRHGKSLFGQALAFEFEIETQSLGVI